MLAVEHPSRARLGGRFVLSERQVAYRGQSLLELAHPPDVAGHETVFVREGEPPTRGAHPRIPLTSDGQAWFGLTWDAASKRIGTTSSLAARRRHVLEA